MQGVDASPGNVIPLDPRGQGQPLRPGLGQVLDWEELLGSQRRVLCACPRATQLSPDPGSLLHSAWHQVCPEPRGHLCGWKGKTPALQLC